jgi:hypothetical protein
MALVRKLDLNPDLTGLVIGMIPKRQRRLLVT